MVAPNGTIVPLQLYTGYDDKYGYLAPQGRARGRGRAREHGTLVGPGLPGGDVAGRDRPARRGGACSSPRAWGNPNARLFWRGGSLLTLPDLFYRNIILGSQVLLAVPVVVRVCTHAEAGRF